MPRSRTRARLHAARMLADPPVRDSTNPMDDDSGRTPARVAYIIRQIRKRLKISKAARAATSQRFSGHGAGEVDD